MKTEFEKMVMEEDYDSEDPSLKEIRNNCRRNLLKYNALDPADKKSQNDLLKELLGYEPNSLVIQAPFFCDYGVNLKFGKSVFFNFNCVILDCAKVTIGDNVWIGPNVQIYTAIHSLNPKERIGAIECAKAIEIGSNCWIGGSALILPGVKIGDNSTIGAGSVVTKDVPKNSLALGNPAKVIRTLEF